jgi:hypothetical protein
MESTQEVARDLPEEVVSQGTTSKKEIDFSAFAEDPAESPNVCISCQ